MDVLGYFFILFFRIRGKLHFHGIRRLTALAQLFPNGIGVESFIFAHHIPTRGNHNRPVPQQLVAALKRGQIDIPRNREHVSSLLRRLTGRNQRSALFRGLNDQDTVAHTADDPVSLGKCPSGWRISRREFADQPAILLHIPEQGSIGHGVNHIHAAAQHPYRRTSCRKGSRCRHAIYSICHAGYHNTTAAGNLISHSLRRGQAIGRCFSCPHNRDCRTTFQIRNLSFIVQDRRRIGNIAQPAGIGCILESEYAQLFVTANLQNTLGLIQTLVTQSFQSRTGQAFNLSQSLPVCIEDVLRVLKPLQQSRSSPVTEAGTMGKPDPVQQHKNSPFSLYGSVQRICHITMVAATAAFKDSQWAFMGMISC